jgi:hypothetical protein
MTQGDVLTVSNCDESSAYCAFLSKLDQARVYHLTGDWKTLRRERGAGMTTWSVKLKEEPTP